MLPLYTKERGTEVAVLIERDVPSHIMQDDTRLRQILHNLLTNSVKFSPPVGNVPPLPRLGMLGSFLAFCFLPPLARDAYPALIGRQGLNHNTLVYQYRLCYTMPLYCTGALSRSVT